MDRRRTVECHITPELLAAVFPPQHREPAPPPELWGFAKDAIVRAEKRGNLATTTELQAVAS